MLPVRYKDRCPVLWFGTVENICNGRLVFALLHKYCHSVTRVAHLNHDLGHGVIRGEENNSILIVNLGLCYSCSQVNQ